MENKHYYIKYLTNEPVGLRTHTLITTTGLWAQSVFTVGDLVAAYKTAVAPLLDHSSLAQLTLHLPDGVARSAITEDCFTATDSTGTALRTGLALTRLNGFELDDLHPLIIKSTGTNFFARESAATYWRVSGTIANALNVQGVRSRVYQNADDYFGYYESGQQALFYEENGTTLNINVLFKTEESALHFDSHIRNESITINSSMNGLTINVRLCTTPTAQLGERIYYKDYIPTDSESPEDTLSVISFQFSTFEQTSDEFKYQRIENSLLFSSIGKAESCHLISRSHCKKYPQTYAKYDKDPNNRLAMSREFHGWFDSLSTATPLFYLTVVSTSDSVIVEGRYKMVLAVVAFSQEAANLIFWRLNEGSTKTDNALIMHTSVYVTDRDVFQICLKWKEKDTLKKWSDFCSMDSAVP